MGGTLSNVGAAAGLAAASVFSGFFFCLVSSPGGGLAVSDEDDVGVQ